jgi:hypothetical protein
VANRSRRKPTKPAKKTIKKPPPRKTNKLAKKAKAIPAVAKKRAAGSGPLDLSEFPPESVVESSQSICLACIWDVFTRHMGLAPKTALAEIKRYTPAIQELNAATPARPYFSPGSAKQACPYCGSAFKWHARVPVYRIESGKATDSLRRELVKSLRTAQNQFAVLEQKVTQQLAFFDWLEKISAQIDLDDSGWLRGVSQHYLSRKEPKVDWRAQFEQTHSIRRSRELDTEWEVSRDRLLLAPVLFDELLLVQYLVSRSHRAGGLTFEGRYTLPELWRRLRNGGYLRTIGVQARNPSDTLEELLAHLSGGDASVRYYYIVDRRQLVKTAALLSERKTKRR